MSKGRILVIDDKPESVELLTEYLLRPNDYEPLAAYDGEQGLQMALEQHPDLIILDQKMPRKSGLEILRELRERMIDTPVILMTAFGSESVVVEALRLGACDYLTKPFDVDQMLNAIQKGLDARRSKSLRDQTWEDMQAWVRRLGSLHDAGSDKVLDLIVESAVQITRSEEGYLLLLNETGDELYLRAEKNLDDRVVRTLRVRVDDSVAGHVLRTGKAVVFNPVDEQQRFKIKTGYLVRSLINVPLRAADGHLIGVLGIANKKETQYFDLDDLKLATWLADYAAVAIENARQFDRVRDALAQRVRELNVIYSLSREFIKLYDVELIVNLVLDQLIAALGADSGAIGLLTDDHPRWVSRGYLSDLIRQTPDGLWNQQAIRYVLQSGRSVCISDTMAEAEWPGLPQTRSALIVPIVRLGKNVGLICLHSTRRYAFDQSSLSFVANLADYILIALENVRLWNDVVEGQRKIEAVLNSMADGVLTVDPQMNIQSWNRAAERITGWGEDQVLGRPCRDILCPQIPSGGSCPLDNVFKPGFFPSTGLEHTIRHRDGYDVIIAISVAPLLDRNGRFVGAVSVFRDISTERRLERSRSEFISMVSHQLRSPLTNVMTSAELLADPNIDNSLKKELIQELHGGCVTLAQFVQNIIDVVELESGHGALKIQPVPLDEVVRKQVAAFRQSCPEREFKLKLAILLPAVRGDRGKIEVVLHNLLDNAVKYSPSDKPVIVQVDEKQDYVEVRVIDHGPGIAAEQMERLFEPFSRGDGSDAQCVYGAGLGLYMAKKFVELHGGTLTVQSRPGRRTCFSFTLPVWK